MKDAADNGFANQLSAPFDVDDWRVEPAVGRISREGVVVHLEPKVMDVLVLLASRAGDVVSREELEASVWAGTIVGYDAVTSAMLKLRKAMQDSSREPRYIETVSKRGYRLIAPVGEPPSTAEAQPPEPSFREVAAPSAAPVSGIGPAAPAESPIRRVLRTPTWLGVLGSGLAVIVLVTTIGLGVGQDWRWPSDGINEPRGTFEGLPVIAVLPLANRSGDPDREYFSDGMTEDINHALGRFSGLRVISSTSVQQFKRRQATLQAIRRELGARYVVSGSVREGDGRLRVTVELSDAENARVLWSERYDRDGLGVFEIQDRIVQSIVGALAIKVTKLERERAASRPPSSLEAYHLVLLARAQAATAQRVANRNARALLAKARDLAPDYAMVYVVESQLQFQRGDMGWTEDPARSLMLAERAARQALEIEDPGARARAHAQLARIYTKRKENDLALAEADQAISLNPSDTFVAEARANALLFVGRTDEAITLLESAVRLDPAGRNSGFRYLIVLAYFTGGRFAEALAACDRGLSKSPDIAFLHAMRAATLAEMGRIDEARVAAAAVLRLQPNFPVDRFGELFVDPAPRARLQGALRTAGL